jgi:hypothetical protein
VVVEIVLPVIELIANMAVYSILAVSAGVLAVVTLDRISA